MTGRRRNAIFGIVFGYAGLFMSLARNIFFVPLYLHSIPLAEYGAWLATGGALALMLINDFGLSGVVTQKISACFGAEDFGKLGSLAGSAYVIGALLALCLSIISVALVPLLPGLDTLSGPQRHTVVQCFCLAIVANALGVIGATAVSVIRSLQRAALAGAIFLVSDLVNIAVLLVFLFGGKGLYSIAAGLLSRSAVVAVAGTIGMSIVCLRSLNVKLIVDWRSVRELVGSSSQFFLSSIAMKVQAQANVLFVNSFLGPTNAAIYSLTVRAHETVLMLLGQINTALVPSVSHLFGSGNLPRFRAVLLRLLLTLGGITAFAMSLTIILNAGFLRLWVGQFAFAGQNVSVMMGIALFASSVGYVAYDALVAQGKFQWVSRAFMWTSALNVLLLLLLVKGGLWLAPTITLFTAGTWGAYFWRKVGTDIGMTAIEVRGLVLELARIVGFSAVVIGGFLFLYPTPTSWLALVVEGLLGAVVLAIGYLSMSTQVRQIMREEIAITVRAMRPT
jgi:O-antigen/teichoic acid export membrane protein